MRRTLASSCAAILLAFGAPPRDPAGTAEAGGAPDAEYASRAQRAQREDAADLRKVVEWADKNGLERTADADWEAVASLDPADEHARKRVHYVRREGAWVRDEPSWEIARLVPDAKPEKIPAYEARRRAEYERPAAARHRALAAWCLAEGLATSAEEELRLALDADPDDYWSRLALGQVPDSVDGWVESRVRVRRVTDDRARATIRRLRAIRSDPVRLEDESTLSKAAGVPLVRWRLREWELETDLPDDDAALALETADLGARWFREFFDLPPGEPVLPGAGLFVVLTTAERYRAVIAAHPGLSDAERAFAQGLGAMPLRHAVDRGPWIVIAERPDGANASDVCLHYAIHLLMQARFGIEAEEAWLYEGLAAYAVARIVGTHDSWCVRLEETHTRYGGPGIPDPPEWPALVYADVLRHEDYPLKGLIGVAPNGLSADMLLKSWSILRWLLEERPDDARVYLAAKRHGLSTPTAIRIATDLPLDAFEQAWRAWVLSIGPE